jgi:AcrR family transcriptional regulator
VPRPRQIDRAAVLRASLALADRGGLGAVTMQAVARQLGVTPMALYTHVAGKQDLLDGLVESLIDEVPAPQAGTQDPLAHMARGLREVAHRHPAVFPLLLLRPVRTPRSVTGRESIHAGLRAAGVPDGQVGRVERIIMTAIMGFAAGEASDRFAAHSRDTLDEDFDVLLEFVAAGVEHLIRTWRSPGGASSPPPPTR